MPVRFDAESRPGCAYRVNLSFLRDGNLVSRKQVSLPGAMARIPYQKERFRYEITPNGVLGEGFEIAFEDGMLTRYVLAGRTLIDSPMSPCFYRKPTDNDGIRGKSETVTKEWEEAGLRYYRFMPQGREILTREDEVVISFKGKILPEGKFTGYFAEFNYHVLKGGLLLVEMKGEPYGFMPPIIPRIGVSFRLGGCYRNAVWYGRGEHENYEDRKDSAIFGLYHKTITEMHTPYERPQENGNRCDTYFAAVTDDIGRGLLFLGCEQFSFSLHDYTIDDLMSAEHRSELKRQSFNTLYLDYRNRAVGNASCGPQPEYELRPHSFSFVFAMKGYAGLDDVACFLSRAFDLTTMRRSVDYQAATVPGQRENFESKD